MPVFNESDMKSLFFHLEEVNARMDSPTTYSVHVIQSMLMLSLKTSLPGQKVDVYIELPA